MLVRRGDIFYIRKSGRSIGSEQNQGRPAVVVSNDMANKYSPVVEVVFLTTQEKTQLPTHVEVICKVPSTALCEQVHSIYADRLEDYIKTCTDEEMEAIDRALMISLGLTEKTDAGSLQNDKLVDCSDEVVKLRAQIELLTRQHEKLLDRLIGQKPELNDLPWKGIGTDV